MVYYWLKVNQMKNMNRTKFDYTIGVIHRSETVTTNSADEWNCAFQRISKVADSNSITCTTIR